MSQFASRPSRRAELRYGVLRLPEATRLAAEGERFLSGIQTLPWDEVAADLFAEVRVGHYGLERQSEAWILSSDILMSPSDFGKTWNIN